MTPHAKNLATLRAAGVSEDAIALMTTIDGMTATDIEALRGFLNGGCCFGVAAEYAAKHATRPATSHELCA